MNIRSGRAGQLIFSWHPGRGPSFNLDIDERNDCMKALFTGEPFDGDGQPDSVANILRRYEDIESSLAEELLWMGEGAEGGDDENAAPAAVSTNTFARFADWLMTNVDFVEITAGSDGDAYAIFETMNDRGLSLTPVGHAEELSALGNRQGGQKPTERRLEEAGPGLACKLRDGGRGRHQGVVGRPARRTGHQAGGRREHRGAVSPVGARTPRAAGTGGRPGVQTIHRARLRVLWALAWRDRGRVVGFRLRLRAGAGGHLPQPGMELQASRRADAGRVEAGLR